MARRKKGSEPIGIGYTSKQMKRKKPVNSDYLVNIEPLTDNQKLLFGFGATLSSIIFFFTLGYLSKFLSNYLNSNKVWKIINILIILFMSALSIFVLINILG